MAFRVGAKAHGQKERDYWMTPDWIMDLVEQFYNAPWLDPCPPDPVWDGLTIEWSGMNYINCPFSQWDQWAKKGVAEYDAHPGSEQIWICHHAHDRGWFRLLASRASAMILLKNRVQFINPKTGRKESTLPGACQTLFYLGHRPDEFIKVFGPSGIYAFRLKPETAHPDTFKSKRCLLSEAQHREAPAIADIKKRRVRVAVDS